LEGGLGVIFILGHSLILAEMGKSSQVGGARMARKLGRRFIGIDLKEDYLEMSRECYLQDEIEEIKEQMEIGARQEVLL